MMVTFISECQKKANNRTRRVLDAFANRIGTNSWQTPITQEGLDAVQKLLRKTASKNTAVSCHQLKSRIRTELLWIIGKRNKFNSEGIVAVNYTEQDKFIGEINMGEIYANTKKQPLDQHLFAVGVVAYLLCKELNIVNSDGKFDKKFARAIFIAGCWHDMGKIDPRFQQWILCKTKKNLINEIPEEGQHIDKTGKFSFKKYPRHNEISLLIYYLLDDVNDKSINRVNKDLIRHSIYWHHAKPIRDKKEEIETLGGVYKKLTKQEVDKILPCVHGMTKKLTKLIDDYAPNLTLSNLIKTPDEDRLHDLKAKSLTRYKNYGENTSIEDFKNDVKINARNNIARTVVITADRLVSSISAEALNSHIEQGTLNELLISSLLDERGLKTDIKNCLDGFKNRENADTDRNQKQNKAAVKLSSDNISVGVLNGPAGCGKTKIALEWAVIANAKKIIWVCPRVQICQGLVNDLTSEEYLPNTKIEIYTGEFKALYQNGKKVPTPANKEFSGDIVLTTIDQIINTITTHTKVTGLVQYMNAHVVFDEYHEYIPMAGFNLLFAELVQCKKIQNKNNTLLVSATPNYYFVRELLELNPSNIVGIDSFNKSQYEIKFIKFDENKKEDNPLYQPQPNNTIVISNTAITAQKSFINNQTKENGLLTHSKFTPKDREQIFEQVFDCFKENGSHKFDILRSGPIIQASLNITCKKMISEFTSAENWLQRMGRLDRFGDNIQVSLYITAIPETLAKGKQHGSCARFLNNKQHCLQNAKAWYAFLTKKLPENKIITIAKIYQIYQEFYNDETSINAIEQDLLKALEYSAKKIKEKIIDPVSFPNKKPKDKKIRIKNNSLRGNNCFVQMAIINIDNGKDKFPDEYVYDETNDESCEKNSLTLEVSLIEGRDFSGEKNPDKDLLSMMYKNQYKILSDKTGKKVKKLNSLLDYKKEAKNSDKPIYVSYTPEDLERLSGNDKKPNPYAFYYAIGKNQPIGVISVDKLTGE